MNKDNILKKIFSHKNDQEYLLGHVVLEELDLTSLIRGSLFENTDVYNIEIVIPTAEKMKYVGTDICKSISDFISSLEQLTESGEIEKVHTKLIDSIGPSPFVSECVRNPLTDEHSYTGYSYHLSIPQWEMLCSHFTV